MASKYASDELFHFVGHASPDDNESNYIKLRLVLNGCCISHYPHDSSWGETGYRTTLDCKLETEELIVPSVTCYADIPFDALSIHISKYGRFGLALPSGLLTSFGARPVTYIPTRSDDWRSVHGSTLLRDIEAIVKGFSEHVVEKQPARNSEVRSLGKKPNNAQAAISALQSMIFKEFLAFIKPFNSELSHNDPNNFYMEREWRKYGNMKFEPDQVSRIVVAKGYKERAQSDYPEYRGKIFEI